MPNIWTHILFCEEVVDTVNQTLLSAKNEAYLKLGAQGPDPFFYYNFWPWIKEEPIHKIGNALHTRNCGNFLVDLVNSVKDQNERMKAYVTGFVTHYILDKNTHPYIHYHAGYEESKHQKLEITIDTIMMKRFHHVNTWKTQVYKEIDVGHSLDKDITALLYNRINEHYPDIKQDSPSYINKAYKDMLLALRILFDPYGWKNTLFKSFISSYSHQPITNQIDYLNVSHATWYHAATKEASVKSFIDLYELAQLEAIEVLKEIKKYWEKPSDASIHKVKHLIGDYSYDTGTALQLNLENKYSNPIV
ncbi:zinc dependent phospholipase C family protein [Oceanobacillus bengalensis]|uniref:Phospholipase C/D domain-containing protein n=1 Tax=Oceanobacillus bengalensis TaxID=1435466 RepID=A0A494Z861_9BACI|nr:zinc dependent phospholipase C family protein [Oceanobacillus bengalensis]RKQ18783.1 hypothetical protein D8M05_01355 [Oceanobacillus bengalensis]